jgi:hypothetical protein
MRLQRLVSRCEACLVEREASSPYQGRRLSVAAPVLDMILELQQLLLCRTELIRMAAPAHGSPRRIVASSTHALATDATPRAAIPAAQNRRRPTPGSHIMEVERLGHAEVLFRGLLLVRCSAFVSTRTRFAEGGGLWLVSTSG